jgi:O-antigen/teichoic acid export membrane protein
LRRFREAGARRFLDMHTMRLSSAVAIGFVSAAWSAGLGLVCVPVFLHYLGIESYGLIGFLIGLQALIHLLDMGLSPTINREVARYGVADRIGDAGALLHSVACIFWLVALMIAATIYAVSGPIARHWLEAQEISPARLETAIGLMGLVIAMRWPAGAYQGALLGAMRIDITSSISMAMSTLANLGAIAVLAFVSPTIEAFFAWQALVGLVHSGLMRHAAWRVLGTEHRRFETSELRRIGQLAAGMTGIALSSVLLMNTDKVILSRLLPLGEFGHYTLAGAAASSLYLLLTPTFNAIYPRMSAYVARKDDTGLAEFYCLGSGVLAAILFPLGMTAAVYSPQLLLLWTRDPALAAAAAPTLSLMVVGTTLNGLMHFPYALQLSSGMTKVTLKINGLMILVMIPLTIWLASEWGATGGAISWALLNVLYVCLGSWLTHRSLLRGIGWQWMLSTVVGPGCASALLIGATSVSILSLGLNPGFTLLLGIAAALAVMGLILSTSSRTRALMS